MKVKQLIEPRKLLPVLLLILACGCSDPKINASSNNALELSIDNVKSSLNEDEEKKFEESLKFIAMQNLNLSEILQSDLEPNQFGVRYMEGIKNKIDGKTAHEIISEADSLRKELEKKQRVQALKEIKELEERKRNAESAKEELSKFEVLSSQFHRQGSGFMELSIIKLTVKNNTEYAISRAYFKGTYATPGRQVPWLVGDFSQSISGGIEPGEEKIMEIMPIDYSWDNLEIKNDAVLTVETVRLDGPDGNQLFSSQGLNEYEEIRLINLKEQFLN